MFHWLSNLDLMFERITITPGSNGSFHQEVSDIGIQNLHEEQVHIGCLYRHPGDGREGEIVDKDSYNDTANSGGCGINTDQED